MRRAADISLGRDTCLRQDAASSGWEGSIEQTQALLEARGPERLSTSDIDAIQTNLNKQANNQKEKYPAIQLLLSAIDDSDAKKFFMTILAPRILREIDAGSAFGNSIGWEMNSVFTHELVERGLWKRVNSDQETMLYCLFWHLLDLVKIEPETEEDEAEYVMGYAGLKQLVEGVYYRNPSKSLQTNCREFIQESLECSMNGAYIEEYKDVAFSLLYKSFDIRALVEELGIKSVVEESKTSSKPIKRSR